MSKIFVRQQIVVLILVVTTTINASRLFYLPLPKFHPSHPVISDGSAESKSNQDEYSLPSGLKHQNVPEKRNDISRWEALLDQKAAATKHRIVVKEVSPGSAKVSDEENQLNKDKVEELFDQLQLSSDQDNEQQQDSWIVDGITGRAEYLQSNPALDSIERKKRRNDTLFLVIVGTCCMVGVLGLVAAAIFWYKIQKRAEAAVDAEYPNYGITGPNSSGSKISPSSTMSDRKLAQSAQMFHYQQQRQQMMAQEKAHLDAKPVHSDDSDDEAPGGGDYTVYECPGLAPTGEMEVRNPLFAEPDSSLASSPTSLHTSTNNHYPQLSTASPPKEKSLP